MQGIHTPKFTTFSTYGIPPHPCIYLNKKFHNGTMH